MPEYLNWYISQKDAQIFLTRRAKGTVQKMTSTIDQKDINNAAWAACDTFRGGVDPAQYKDCILVMLFIKYISNVWQDHYKAFQK